MKIVILFLLIQVIMRGRRLYIASCEASNLVRLGSYTVALEAYCLLREGLKFIKIMTLLLGILMHLLTDAPHRSFCH